MRTLLSAHQVMRRVIQINTINSRLLDPKPTNHFFARYYQFTPQMSSITDDQHLVEPKEPFRPKTALLLTKFSRYEFEKRRNPGLSEEELSKNVCIIDVLVFHYFY